MEDRRASPLNYWILLGSVSILIWAAANTSSFTAFVGLNALTAFAMGFIKLFCLGTLGEIIKTRMKTGDWYVPQLLRRAIVWGLYGVWFTAAFPAFAAATEALIAKGMWFSGWKPLSMSLAINLFGGFAWGMMVLHEYCNHLIANGWQARGLKNFAGSVNNQFIFAFLPKTIIFFWVPAHTVTFALSPELRVLFAAVLAIFLGFFLSFGKK